MEFPKVTRLLPNICRLLRLVQINSRLLENLEDLIDRVLGAFDVSDNSIIESLQFLLKR